MRLLCRITLITRSRTLKLCNTVLKTVEGGFMNSWMRSRTSWSASGQISSAEGCLVALVVSQVLVILNQC